MYRAAWDIKTVTVLQNHIQVNASIIGPQFVLIPEFLFREKKKQKNNFLPQAWSADYDYIMNKTQIHYCKMFPVYSSCEQPAKITAFIRPTCLSDSLTASTITIQEDGTMTWYWKCFRFRVIENQDHVHPMWTVVFKDSFNNIFTQPKFLFVEIGNKCHWSWHLFSVEKLFSCVFSWNLDFGFWLLWIFGLAF